MKFGLFSAAITDDGDFREIAAETYDEWLSEVVLADRLGFSEAWIAEHPAGPGHSRPDTLASAELFICKAAGLTKQIRFGTAVRPIAFYQPIQVALEACMVDHLTHGRYNFGFGSGLGPTIAFQRGLDDNRRRDRMHEAMEIILRCWTSEEPFDWDGEFYHLKGLWVYPKPFQKPHMPVAVPTDTPETLELAARNGFLLLQSAHDEPAHMRETGDGYVRSARAAGQNISRNDLRACRYVYVSDSVKKAKEEIREAITPSIESVKQRFPHRFRHIAPGGDVSKISLDYMVDSGVSPVGDPDTVYGHLKNLYDESDGFGTLLLQVGKRFGTRRQRARSMRLFTQEVAPRLASLVPDGNGEV